MREESAILSALTVRFPFRLTKLCFYDNLRGVLTYPTEVTMLTERRHRTPPSVLRDFAAFVILNVAERLEGHVRVLLIQDGDTGTERWKMPGGKRLENMRESWNEAATREIREELGISLPIHSEDALSIDPVSGANPHDFVVFVHRKEGLRLEQLKLGEGIKRAALFDERQLAELLLANRVLPKHIAALERYLVDNHVLLR